MAEYIEREEAEKLLAAVLDSDCKIGYAKYAMNRFRKIPAADVRPVKPGHWIRKENTISACSECGRKYGFLQTLQFAFCPNCGADMRGGDDDGAT